MSEDKTVDIIELIKKLKPVEFKYKGQDKKTFGFVAQDLLEIFPEDEYTIVGKDKDRLLFCRYKSTCSAFMYMYSEVDKRKRIITWHIF